MSPLILCCIFSYNQHDKVIMAKTASGLDVYSIMWSLLVGLLLVWFIRHKSWSTIYIFLPWNYDTDNPCLRCFFSKNITRVGIGNRVPSFAIDIPSFAKRDAQAYVLGMQYFITREKMKRTTCTGIFSWCDVNAKKYFVEYSKTVFWNINLYFNDPQHNLHIMRTFFNCIKMKLWMKLKHL